MPTWLVGGRPGAAGAGGLAPGSRCRTSAPPPARGLDLQCCRRRTRAATSPRPGRARRRRAARGRSRGRRPAPRARARGGGSASMATVISTRPPGPAARAALSTTLVSTRHSSTGLALTLTSGPGRSDHGGLVRDPGQLGHLAGQRAQADLADRGRVLAAGNLVCDDVQQPGHLQGQQFQPETRVLRQVHIPAHCFDQIGQCGHLMSKIMQQAPHGKRVLTVRPPAPAAPSPVQRRFHSVSPDLGGHGPVTPGPPHPRSCSPSGAEFVTACRITHQLTMSSLGNGIPTGVGRYQGTAQRLLAEPGAEPGPRGGRHPGRRLGRVEQEAGPPRPAAPGGPAGPAGRSRPV